MNAPNLNEGDRWYDTIKDREFTVKEDKQSGGRNDRVRIEYDDNQVKDVAYGRFWSKGTYEQV